MSKEKLITFNAEEEHFSSQEGFMTLMRRIQHFQLDQFGVVIIKCPKLITINQKKKLLPLLEEVHLTEYQRQKTKFVVEDFYSMARIEKATKDDPEYVKRRYNWKQWVRKHGNKYLSTSEEFWDLIQEKRNSKQAIEYGVAEPGTLIAEGMSIWNFLYLYFGPASYRYFGHRWCVKLAAIISVTLNTVISVTASV